MCACSAIVSNIIDLGSSTLPSNLAIVSGNNSSFEKNLAKVFLGMFSPSIIFTIAFNLAAGVVPSCLPFARILFTICIASFFIVSLYKFDPFVIPGIGLLALCISVTK